VAEGGGPVFRPVTGDVPVAALPHRRRIVVRLDRRARLLGGVVNLITTSCGTTRSAVATCSRRVLWAQIGLFVMGFLAFLAPGPGEHLAGSAYRAAGARSDGSAAWRCPTRRAGSGSRSTFVAILLALGSGAAWSGNWETVLPLRQRRRLGRDRPHARPRHRLLRLRPAVPALPAGWATTTLIAIGILTLATYAARALRWQFHLSAPVRAHLSVIGALLLVVIAAGYQLDIADLAYSTRGLDSDVQAPSTPTSTPSCRPTRSSRSWPSSRRSFSS
jgi:hypothetical protein